MLLSISLVAEEVFSVGGYSVTNSLLTTWIGMVFMVLLIIAGMSRGSLIPKGGQLVLESVYVFFLNLCESVLEDKKTALRVVPFITTIFIFVFTANIFTVIPGVGTIGLREAERERTPEHIARAFFPIVYAETTSLNTADDAEVSKKTESDHFTPLFRPGSADLNTTLALAIISVIAVQIAGFKALGLGYLKKFFNFTSPVNFFVGILELISEFAKIISFAFRLFGNIFAGEVLLAVMLMLVPYFLPIPFYGLEVFVAIIQAFVFAMLTLVFIKLATVSHGGEHH